MFLYQEKNDQEIIWLGDFDINLIKEHANRLFLEPVFHTISSKKTDIKIYFMS